MWGWLKRKPWIPPPLDAPDPDESITLVDSVTEIRKFVICSDLDGTRKYVSTLVVEDRRSVFILQTTDVRRAMSFASNRHACEFLGFLRFVLNNPRLRQHLVVPYPENK